MPALYKQLIEYSKTDFYPGHMPGHKRQVKGDFLPEAYKLDITEIDGFDNLHDAQGIIKEAEDRAARLYKSEETHFLVNGSTCGILAAISSVTQKGDTILISRNCHKAAYHAILLNELKPIYLYPAINQEYDLCGGISEEQISERLKENSQIKAVMITSPSYDGVVSNVGKIAEAVHKYKIPLIVDEAHGAHFGFSEEFPKTSIEQGADLVIHSVHKTLPAFTQSALLHVNGILVNRERVRRYLSIYQTSSPSYLLMAGIDYCMEFLEKEGKKKFKEFADCLTDFYKRTEKLKHLRLVTKSILGQDEIYDFDRGKLIISTKKTNISGKELYERLVSTYHIQPEMAAGSYCLLIMTIMDIKKGYDRLWRALVEVDQELDFNADENKKWTPICCNKERMTAYQAIALKRKWVSFEDSIGKTSAEYIFLYPPGIPLIIPGEEISEEFVNQLSYYQKQRMHVCGLNPENEKEIAIIWEEFSIF